MIHVMPNIYGDDSITVKVVELGAIEVLGQPGVVCVTEENNLSSMKTSLLYRECVLVEQLKIFKQPLFVKLNKVGFIAWKSNAEFHQRKGC